jgi:phosphoenolpyruvate synthase/pyruvate phosphate dikinase
MFFNEEFIAKVEDDPIVGIVDACEMVLNRIEELSDNQSWSEEEHELLWESASFVRLIVEVNNFNVDIEYPDATGDIASNCQALSQYINAIRDSFKEHAVKLSVESYTSRYKTALKNSFAYEFSQGDLERIQSLVNELRGQISENTNLYNAHNQRLLRRLENLQSELHKRVSDLDRFWGLVGDAGVVLGKLGTDAKPIVDRVREIAEIAWKTQARAEELPSDSPNPMIEHDS